jgi:hypothetical protein
MRLSVSAFCIKNSAGGRSWLLRQSLGSQTLVKHFCSSDTYTLHNERIFNKNLPEKLHLKAMNKIGFENDLDAVVPFTPKTRDQFRKP